MIEVDDEFVDRLLSGTLPTKKPRREKRRLQLKRLAFQDEILSISKTIGEFEERMRNYDKQQSL